MGRIIAVEYLSLDGVMEAPAWTGPYFDADVAAFQQRSLFASDALLLGRVTYEGFKQAWPKMNEDEFGQRMNTMPKHVATTTLPTPEWNATFLATDDSGDAVEAVADLATGEQSLLIYGSGRFSESLRAAGLIDEYRLIVAPVVLGSGQRLFVDATPSTFVLTEARAAASGMALLTYTRS